MAGQSSVWRNRQFRRIWVASTVSSFGSEVAEIALPMLALLTLSASAVEVGLLRVAQFLPFLLATLPLGVLVDRRRRHRLALMVSADLGRFMLIAAIPITIWLGVARIELIYVLMFCAGVLTVLYQIADFALLPSVVEPAQLVDANGKISAGQSANEIGGRGAAGLLVQAISAPAAIAVNAVAFLVSGLTLRNVTSNQAGSIDDEPRRSVWTEVGDGLALAVRHRVVRALLGEATTFNLFNELFIVGLLIYAVRELGLGPAAVGLVFTAGGVGSFVGAWFGARLTARFGYGRVLLIMLILGNTAPLGVALTHYAAEAAPAVLCGVFVVMGVGIGVANVHAVTLRQTAVPERLRGRVNAAYRLISWGAVPFGAALGGYLAGRAGAEETMLAGAIGVSLATLWVACSPVPGLRTVQEASSY
jgi:MFS family permease